MDYQGRWPNSGIGSKKSHTLQKQRHQGKRLIDSIDDIHLTSNPPRPERRGMAIQYFIQLAKCKMFPRGERLESCSMPSLITKAALPLCMGYLFDHIWSPSCSFCFRAQGRQENPLAVCIFIPAVFLLCANDRLQSCIHRQSAPPSTSHHISDIHILPRRWGHRLALDDINTYQSQATKTTYGLQRQDSAPSEKRAEESVE